VDNKIIRLNNNNTETIEKRSISNFSDMPSKLDFCTLQSIAHQTARSEAGILMTTSDVEIGDIGMLSYRLPVAPQTHHSIQAARRSFSCLDNQNQSNLPIKWELTSRTQVLTNDPLGLLNPVSQTAPPPSSLPINRSASMMARPFANLNSSTETKPIIHPTATIKEDEVSSSSSLFPTSITQLRAKLSQTPLANLYSPKNLNTLKTYALDRLTDLKTTVVSTTIPLTQSKSLYAVKPSSSSTSKERSFIKENVNNKHRGSMSSLLSQQSSNSSSLNTNNINGIDITNIHDDIKSSHLNPSSVAIPITSDDNDQTAKQIVEISSCNRCTACDQFLYDEEIMSSWSPEDSDLHTVCVHCKQKTIPNLTILIRVRETDLSSSC